MKRLLLVLLFALPAPAARELSPEWMMEQTRTHHLTTIESLLEKFTPRSLERHLLIYGSDGSLQFASFRSPRVVVYSYDADFIMTFNGEPGSKGFYDLEILQFDKAARRFKPSVIHFDPAAKQEPVLDANPTVCAGCHRADIRPNWDPYFHWAGFYGSEDDNENPGHPHYPRLAKGPEHEHFVKFLERKQKEIEKKEGRYRFLPKHPADRPNLDFNDRVTCLNAKRFMRIFSQHPLSGQIWNHQGFGGVVEIDKLPKELLAGARRPYAEVRADTERVIRAAVKRRVQRQILLTGAEPLGRVRKLVPDLIEPDHAVFDVNLAASWRYVFEEILKLPFDAIPTSFRRDYELNSAFGFDIGMVGAGATTDPKTGRLVLSRDPVDASIPARESYYFSCRRDE